MISNKGERIQVLFVDDINLILEGYCRIVEKFTFPSKEIYSRVVTDCDTAWTIIKTEIIHLVILDLNFSSTHPAKMQSGEALGTNIRKCYPQIKLIILTGVVDSVRIDKLLNGLNPEGLLIKGETNSREIFKALQLVLNDEQYYSPSVNMVLRDR